MIITCINRIHKESYVYVSRLPLATFSVAYISFISAYTGTTREGENRQKDLNGDQTAQQTRYQAPRRNFGTKGHLRTPQ